MLTQLKTTLEEMWDRDVDTTSTIEGLQKIVGGLLNSDVAKQNAAKLIDNMPRFIIRKAKEQQDKVEIEIVRLRDLVQRAEITEEGVYLSIEENPEVPGDFSLRVSRSIQPTTVQAVKGPRKPGEEYQLSDVDKKLTHPGHSLIQPLK